MDFWDWILILFIYIPLALCWAFSLFDIFRRHDFSGVKKALWVLAVLAFPLAGTFAYVVVRPADPYASEYYDTSYERGRGASMATSMYSM